MNVFPIEMAPLRERKVHLPLLIQYFLAVTHAKADVLQGTVDVMVLKTLDTLGPTHGYRIARGSSH
jgi:transcriptional regulator with GAF, ATPase, and Fis domain